MNHQVSKANDAGLTLLSLLCSVLALAVAIVPAALLVAVVCSRGMSPTSLTNAGFAGTICWLAGSLALAATFLGNRFHAPVQGMLLGMMFRMGLPLAALVAVSQLESLREMTGLPTTILGVYLVALVVETVLALRMVPVRTSAIRAA